MSVHGSNIVIRRADHATVIAFSRPDVIDTSYIKQVGDELYEIVRTLEPPRLVIDFEGVRYLSSSALGMLVALNDVILEREGQMCIANVLEEVNGVFRLTKLPRVIRIFETVKEALRNLSG